MGIEANISELFDRIGRLEIQVDSIEANQRNAESGTTDCSSRQDACLSKENRAFQPTGNPDNIIEELEDYLNDIIAYFDVYKPNNDNTRRRLADCKTVLAKLASLKECRGC